MRLHKTRLNECYRIAFRKKIDDGAAALPADLDIWLDEDNPQREHPGRWCDGNTPLQTFHDALALAKETLMPHSVAVAA
ncbi:hypothetical protein [Pandoraea sputorum]|uniref:hypothetical protein n=1 Tax=Pandoraea sputorum TaxID=93222 RepID=UPI0012410C94|nr:hypothetical protein [Pandoraea sputorum]